MFNRLASLINRRAAAVLVAAVIFVGIAAVFGSRAFGALSGGGFLDPASESSQATDRLEQASGQVADGGLIALIRMGQDVNAPAVRDEADRVAQIIGVDPAVAQVLTYYTTRSPAFVSKDGQSTFVLAYFKRGADNVAAASRLKTAFDAGPRVSLGGAGSVNGEINSTVTADLGHAEEIAFPILFLLSLWVFRGVIAALMPLLIGAVTILATFLGLYLITRFAPVSSFVISLATGMGLGLSIDYSLFMVSRYREELARGLTPADAIRRTLNTAGRTIFFSALTVAAALASLLVFPLNFLASMGAAGVLVALLASTASLVLLSAILKLLGPRINALAPRSWHRARPTVSTWGFWYRLSRFVMRRPLPIAVASAAVLIALGLPFLNIKFTGVDATVLPTSHGARQVNDYLAANFPSGVGFGGITLVAEAGSDRAQEVNTYATTLASLPHVQAVDQAVPVGTDTMRIEVRSDAPKFSPESLAIVKQIRAEKPPFPVLVGGASAEFFDLQASLGSHLPLAVAIVVIFTLLLLFLATGSAILPVKAVLMNFLTLSVALGVCVVVFQWGIGHSVLGFKPGPLNQTQPLLLFAIVFGLSTDYGVFLLTRIKEMRDAGMGNREAVAAGLERTGRIVTAAALLFTVAIGAFVTSQIVFIKLLGVGIAAGVVIDATVVRGLLVPSLMALLGDWNWWAPGPLRRVYGRIGVHEAEPPADQVSVLGSGISSITVESVGRSPS